MNQKVKKEKKTEEVGCGRKRSYCTRETHPEPQGCSYHTIRLEKNMFEMQYLEGRQHLLVLLCSMKIIMEITYNIGYIIYNIYKE